VTPFGGCVNKFEADLLQCHSLGVGEERFTEGKHPLAGSHDASLEHEEVLVDHTVMVESSHGCDGLVGKIEWSRGTLLVSLNSNTVYLLVDLSPVMVSELSSPGD